MNHLSATEFPMVRAIYLRAIHILNDRSHDLWQGDIESLRKSMDALIESQYAQELDSFSDEFANRLVHEGGWELCHFPYYMRDEHGVWQISNENARSLLKYWPDPTQLPDGFPDQKLSDIEALEELLFQRRKEQGKKHPTEAQCYALTALEKVSLTNALFSESNKSHRSKEILTKTLLQASTAVIEAMEMVCTGERKLLIEKLPSNIAEEMRKLDSEVMGNARRAMAKAGAKSRWHSDPKTIAKQDIKECWNLWQRDPARYPSKAAFARDMLEKYIELKNPETILRWCRDWQEEAASTVTTLPARS